MTPNAIPYNLVEFGEFCILSPFGLTVSLPSHDFNGTNVNIMPYKQIKSVYFTLNISGILSPFRLPSYLTQPFTSIQIISQNFETICTSVNKESGG